MLRSRVTNRFWTTADRERLIDTPVFSVRRDRKHRPAHPDDTEDFYVIESVDWVNVIPVTEQGEIVFIEHYRHGTDEVRLEIPGGMIDPSDPSPSFAAAREMREETGYASDPLVEIGVVRPNPALQVNHCHTFLAENARLVGPPRPDDTEDIRVVLHPKSEVPRLMREGRISHALVVAAFHWLALSEA